MRVKSDKLCNKISVKLTHKKMNKIILFAILLMSCSDIEQPIAPKLNIIECICKNGTTQVYKPHLIKEINRITQFLCSANGGIKEYIYK
jgi:hypothetical protein